MVVPGPGHQAPIGSSLIGTWRSTHEVEEDGSFVPMNPRFGFVMTLRADGSAEYRNISREWDHLNSPIPPPFGVVWDVTETGTLAIYIPIAPMPEYEIYDWIQEAIRYDIIKIEPGSLILSDRAHDGESTILLRREPTDSPEVS